MQKKEDYFSKELLFCLRVSDAGFDDEDYIRETINNNFDWDVFFNESLKHRLFVSVARKLLNYKNLLPEDKRILLKNKLHIISKSILKINTETINIQRIFKEQGIVTFTLKGAKLTETLYGNPLERFTRDVDLIVPIEKFELSLQILKELGYTLTPPFSEYSDDQINLVFRESNQLQFQNENSKTILELHWKLIKHKFLEAEINEKFENFKIFADFSEINIYNTFFLILHGSFHNWNRLFWLRDIRFIFSGNFVNLHLLHQLFKKYKLEHIFYQTLLMLEYVYNFDISEYKEQIEKDSIRLRNLSLFLLNNNGDTKPYIMTYYQIKYRMALYQDFEYKWQVFKSQLFRISDLSRDKKYWFISYPLAPITRYFKFLEKRNAKRKK